MDEKQRLIIIDGNSLVNRAFYALPPLTNAEGKHTNAAYGFTTMLFNLMENERPDYLAVAFDLAKPTFRHVEFAQYKSHRRQMPEELREQLPLVKEICRALGIPVLECEGFEADDLIGTVATLAAEKGIKVAIVTGDRDALQLVSSHIVVMLTRKGITDTEFFDVQAIRGRYGIEPSQVVDLKGLMGDASDNIPGVPGVGEKTALKLVQQFGTVENLLDNLAQVSGKKLQTALAEYADQAKLSKRLATIDCQVPCEIDFAQLRVGGGDRPKLLQLFQEYQFKSLLRRIEQGGSELISGLVPAAEPTNAEMDAAFFHFILIESLDQLQALVDKAHNTGNLAFVTVTDQANPMYGSILGFGLCLNDHEGYYLSLENTTMPLAEVQRILASLFTNHTIKKFCHDAKHSMIALQRWGIELHGLVFDTMVAAYLLHATQSGYDLADLARQYLHLSPMSVLQASLEDSRSAAAKAIIIYRLCGVLTEELRSRDLLPLFNDVEMPLIEVLSAMQFQGVSVDLAYLREMSSELAEKIEVLTREIYQLAGEEFNINSTKQLGAILFEKLKLPVGKRTKTGYSTDVEVLESLEAYHPIIPKLLEYRQLVKLKSTYTDGLANLINPVTGKIHTTFNQTVTATGRLSSTEPNLQNIPIRWEEGRKIRKVFIPSKADALILAADYSQIELRIMAHMAQDTALINAFKTGQDIHTATATEVFGKRPEEVTPEMRRAAKAVNFGIIYGISDFGLAKDIKVTRKEAQAFIERYFERYPGVKRYLDSTVATARQQGYVTTILNRRRYLPDLHSSNRNVRAFAERTAMNTPIQGSAADIIKLAMVKVQRELLSRNLETKMILQVHDELVFEVPHKELDEVKELVKRNMEGAVELLVPLEVEIKAGPNWYELKKLL